VDAGPWTTRGVSAALPPRLGLWHRVAKRACDVVLATVVLVVLLPVATLIVLAIVAESGRPVFYHANRIGHRGRRLRMLKFRKMRSDVLGRALTIRDDERLTHVGRFLMQTRLDELPQLWHVLRGEMSLVGPRPEDPAFVTQRWNDYQEILLARPGIAGLSQLAFADESSVLDVHDPVGHYIRRILPQKCALDRLYLRQATLRTDLLIVGWTMIAVILRRPVAVDRATGRMSLRCRRPGQPGAEAPVASESAWRAQ
jgi:lipopolysaccharide/colanic/teichoic acid biosynthesis glycosyltransferase